MTRKSLRVITAFVALCQMACGSTAPDSAKVVSPSVIAGSWQVRLITAAFNPNQDPLNCVIDIDLGPFCANDTLSVAMATGTTTLNPNDTSQSDAFQTVFGGSASMSWAVATNQTYKVRCSGKPFGTCWTPLKSGTLSNVGYAGVFVREDTVIVGSLGFSGRNANGTSLGISAGRLVHFAPPYMRAYDSTATGLVELTRMP
jgi:hypothetical protein